MVPNVSNVAYTAKVCTSLVANAVENTISSYTPSVVESTCEASMTS